MYAIVLYEELNSLGFRDKYDFIYLPMDNATYWSPDRSHIVVVLVLVVVVVVVVVVLLLLIRVLLLIIVITLIIVLEMIMI